MAQLDKSGIQFLGTLDNLSAYKMRGSDKIILRRKGGPTRAKAKKSEAYVNPRRNSSEFGGRSTTTKWFTPILHPVRHIADHSISGQLNGLLKPAQELDKLSEWGKRNVLLSLNPKLLEGYNLNRKFVFETILRPGLSYTLSKDTMSARVQIPALVPGDNLFIPGKFDWYRIDAVLGVIPDHFFDDGDYYPSMDFPKLFPVHGHTDWFAASEGSTAIELKLSLPATSETSFSLVLLGAVSLGEVKGVNYIKPAKYVGAGKIIGMA